MTLPRPFIQYSTVQNPDKRAIESKDIININVSLGDISASNTTQSINLNIPKTELVVYIDSTETTGSLYYTPMYTEVISYRTWRNTINKAFTELSAL